MLFAANSVRRSTHEQAIICMELLTGEGVGCMVAYDKAVRQK